MYVNGAPAGGGTGTLEKGDWSGDAGIAERVSTEPQCAAGEKRSGRHLEEKAALRPVS